MAFIKGRDTIRGTDGSIIWKVGDVEYDFFHITQLTINMEIEQDEVPRIGTHTKGHKTSTVNISGSGTGYYGDPVIRREMTKYVKGGAYPDMQIILTNYDHDTQAATQTFVGKGVMVTSLVLAEIDATTTKLEEDFDFTLEDYEIITEFNETIPETSESIEIGTI